MQATITYFNPFDTDLSALPSVTITFAKEGAGITPEALERRLALVGEDIDDATRLCVNSAQVRNIVVSDDPNAGVGATDDTIYLIFQ